LRGFIPVFDPILATLLSNKETREKNEGIKRIKDKEEHKEGVNAT